MTQLFGRGPDLSPALYRSILENPRAHTNNARYHTKSSSWSSNSDTSNKPPRVRACHICGDTSHLQRACPQRASGLPYQHTDQQYALAGADVHTASVGGAYSSVYLGNIPPPLTDQDLLMLVQPFGAVSSVRVVPRSRCAFVNFVHPETAAAFHAHVSSGGCQLILGSSVKLGWATPK